MGGAGEVRERRPFGNKELGVRRETCPAFLLFVNFELLKQLP